MTAFTYRMPAGIPGAITRESQATIEAQLTDSSTYPTAYGVAVKLVSGKVQPIASGDAASVVYGFLVRPFPAHSSQDPLGTSTPPTAGICNVLRRGYIAVKLARGTAAKNGAVYVRVTADTGGKAVGDIETAADSGKCVAITGAIFTDAADASGNVEIAYNI